MLKRDVTKEKTMGTDHNERGSTKDGKKCKQRMIHVGIICTVMILLIETMLSASLTVQAASGAPNGIYGNGTAGINININGEPYTTYANIPTWGQYAYGKQGCAWFASARVKELTGIGDTIWSGSSWWNNGAGRFGFSTGKEIKAKALACYTGHVAVVEKIVGDTVYISEGGSSGYGATSSNGYTIIRATTVSKVINNPGETFLGFVYLPVGGDDGSSTVNSWVKNTGVTGITETTARINATLSPSATVSEIGFYLGTSPDNMTKREEVGTTKVINIWYDLGTGKWTSALSKGTTYYYQIYAIIGGVTYTTALESFTTTGDGIAPIISNVQVTDVNTEGYTVTCDVTDNVGVARVSFPTWTDANGQDDIAGDWYNATAVYQPIYGNTYSFRVNVSDHNWEEGGYTTHIYAYDAAGNSSNAGTTVTIVRTFPLTGFNLNTTTLNLQKDVTQTLYITSYEPSNTTSDKTAYWSSANTAIAVVDSNGNVTGKSSGTTTITCSVAGITRQCTVVVSRNVPFVDVQQGSWYYDYVADVYEQGYMVGSGNGIFNPEGMLTRSEIVTTLYSVNGKPNTFFVDRFSDVSNGQWYSNPISWAYRNGIVSGYADGRFGTNDLITREQFALMLYQYATVYGYNTNYNVNALANYNDIGSVSTWAETAMKWAVTNEIISGKGGGLLDPKGNATRAECATMIMKLSQLAQ